MRGTAILVFCVACSSSSTAPNGGGGGGGGDMTPADAATMTSADAAPSAARCTGKSAQPLDATWTLTVGGLARTAQVHVPAAYDPTRATPIVLDFHGLGGDAAMEEALTSANALADIAGFISVHPQGATNPGSWNAGSCCGTAPQQNIDDMAFVGALLDELDARLCADDDRVYAMGMSNGAYLSHRLGCELADRFAAIAPVAGGIAVTCNPTRPVAVFAVHGDADPVVSYSFGKDGAQFWADHNGCTTSSVTYQHGTVTCTTHTGCTAGADVTWCSVSGGGHQWPGGETIPFLGSNTNDLDTTAAAWKFFAAHPRT